MTKITIIAFGLWCNDDDLPELNNSAKLIKVVQKFAEDALADLTELQIVAAIDYVLNGNDPRTSEEFKDDESIAHVVEFPDEVKSSAQMLLNKALDWNINFDTASNSTLENLQRMILTAIIKTGADITKNMQLRSSSEFFAACGKIHTRLKKEKENGES